MPRLHFNEKLLVRQYIISDPSITYYTEYFSSLKENLLANLQQQVKNTPTNVHDHQSDRQHCNSATIRPLPLLDNYMLPLLLRARLWFRSLSGHSNLQLTPSALLQGFHQKHTDIEHDQPETDQHLNTILSAASVDPWQNTRVDIHPTTQQTLTEELPQNGPPVTLTATVEERFVNTLIC